MDGQTTRLSADAAHWANQQVGQGRFGSTDEVVDAAIALYRAELEDEPEIDWDKAHALAGEAGSRDSQTDPAPGRGGGLRGASTSECRCVLT